jgi:hypothetical protein
VNTEKILKDIQRAVKSNKKVLFRHNGRLLEAKGLKREGEKIFIDLKTKPESKYGKCNTCGKGKYLSFGKCGKCWKEHEKQMEIERANNYIDIP